jgi:hypothetical protein
MSTGLDRKLQIHTLASDLGLQQSATPCQCILQSVESRVKVLKKKFICETLNELLIAIANDVGTIFREIRFDSDLQKIQEEYVSKGELIFANLSNDLSQPDDYGITIGLHHQKAWDPKFVSVIDCRGDKGFRTYFTKWHELAHLLTLTPQMRLVFRRSHSRENSNDPEEKLMDVIASSLGFHADFFPESVRCDISFEGIATIKSEFCPDASIQAATIGIVKAFPSPCILVEAEMALKKDEAAAALQTGFAFCDVPKQSLRAVHATVNDSARQAGLQFFKNWRVPLASVIRKVFDGGGYAEADEDLSWWSTSDGRHLKSLSIRVKAVKNGKSVKALLIPINS